MTQVANKKKRDKKFDIGEWVYLKLQPYRQSSLEVRKNEKLFPKYFGPYKILDKVGTISYRLELTEYAKIHPVFHVSQLKKCHDPTQSTAKLPAFMKDSDYTPESEAILERQLVKRGRQPTTMIFS